MNDTVCDGLVLVGLAWLLRRTLLLFMLLAMLKQHSQDRVRYYFKSKSQHSACSEVSLEVWCDAIKLLGKRHFPDRHEI